MNNDRYVRSAPVNEGDVLDVKIEALGEKGDGIAKKNGFVLVVPGTQVNDQVKVKVTKVLKRVGFAEVVGRTEESGEEVQEEPQEEEPMEADEEENPKKDKVASKKKSEPEESEFSEDFGEEE